jgi:HSP20 family protein
MKTSLDLWRPDFWRSSFRSPPREQMRDMLRFQDRMDQMFEEAFSSFPTAFEPLETTAIATPYYDIDTNDQQYLLTFDIPGVPKENLKVEVSGDQLMVSGERKAEHRQKMLGKEATHKAAGTFYRSLTIPNDVDADKINADYKDGVLSLVLPRTGAVKGKQILIGEMGAAKPQKAA